MYAPYLEPPIMHYKLQTVQAHFPSHFDNLYETAEKTNLIKLSTWLAM